MIKKYIPTRSIRSFVVVFLLIFPVFLIHRWTDLYGPGPAKMFLSLAAIGLLSVFAINFFTVLVFRTPLDNVVSRLRDFPGVRNKLLSVVRGIAAPAVKIVLASHGAFYLGLCLLLNHYVLIAVFGLVILLFIVRRFYLKKPIRLFALYWTAVLLCMPYAVMYNRVASNEEACNALPASPEVKTVFGVEDFRRYPELDNSYPYQVITDSEDRAVFVTFKNLHGSGAIVRLDEDGGGKPVIYSLRGEGDGSSMFYPERMCIDMSGKKLYATMKAAGNYRVFVMDYSGGGMRPEEPIRTADIETTNCIAVPSQGRLYILFIPHMLQATAPFLRVYRTEDRRLEKEFHNPGALHYADYFFNDTQRNRIIIPSMLNLLTLDTRELEMKAAPLKAGRYFRYPTLGIAGDPARDRFYLTSSILKSVLEVEGEGLRVLRRVPVGMFPREIAADTSRQILYVADYSGGSIFVLDIPTFQVIRKYRVGPLVRSVYVDPHTHRSFGTSACGVFEFRPRVKRRETRGTSVSGAVDGVKR